MTTNKVFPNDPYKIEISMYTAVCHDSLGTYVTSLGSFGRLLRDPTDMAGAWCWRRKKASSEILTFNPMFAIPQHLGPSNKSNPLLGVPAPKAFQYRHIQGGLVLDTPIFQP